MARAGDIEALLEETVPPQGLRKGRRKRSRLEKPALIAQWEQERRDAAPRGWFKRWASSQVAGYRLELIIGYLTVMFFGGSAIAAGIPVFSFTTPAGWTPIWGSVVVVAGLVAAVGALRAGEEPQTKLIRVFNRIELGGAIGLFLTLGAYATILLLVGYGVFGPGDVNRVAGGAGFTALAAHPAIRMVWLIFRPGKLVGAPADPSQDGTRVSDVDTGETGISG